MLWLLLAFTSAALLGFYDVCKKHALRGNDVLTVLWLNTLFCSLLFVPAILMSASGYIDSGSMYYVPATSFEEQRYIMLKAVIVLSSWLLWNEMAATYSCRSHQRNKTCHGSGGCDVGFRRTA